MQSSSPDDGHHQLRADRGASELHDSLFPSFEGRQIIVTRYPCLRRQTRSEQPCLRLCEAEHLGAGVDQQDGRRLLRIPAAGETGPSWRASRRPIKREGKEQRYGAKGAQHTMGEFAVRPNVSLLVRREPRQSLVW